MTHTGGFVDQVVASHNETPDDGAASASDVLALLREWLLARLRDPAEGPAAIQLLPELARWFRPSSADGEANARRYVAALVRKLSRLSDFIDLVDERVPPQSTLARWRRSALAIVDLWAGGLPDHWQTKGATLTRQRNPLWFCALADSLPEAVLEAQSKSLALKTLRENCASEFGDCQVPPSVKASWDPNDYIALPRDRAIVDELIGAIEIASSVRSNDSSGGVSAPMLTPALETLHSRLAKLRAGWPVAAASIDEALRAIARHAGSDERIKRLSTELESRRKPAASPIVAPPQSARTSADQDLRLLGQKLLDSQNPEAAGIAKRIIELSTNNELDQKLRGVFGCLLSLANGSDEAIVSGWRRSTADELMRVSRSMPRCEILGEQLLDQPIGAVAPLIKVVEIAADSSGGSSPRVTRVLRPGFALLDAAGHRAAVIPARVRTSA